MKQISIQTSQGVIRLNDRNYLAAGGQAAVYRVGKTAYKIYHDQGTMIPVGKIQELAKISSVHVVKPLEVVSDVNNGNPLGYAMNFIDGGEAICKLFTRAFKDSNHLGLPEIAELLKHLQGAIHSIHDDRCLVVDLNELNVLVIISSKGNTPLLIDTDSFQTPNFRATAIMDSIRDRQAKPGVFNEGTDWFSYAVIATQCYLNIHPYKGRHPDYKLTEWQKRMDDGVSIFDPQVRLPLTANPVNVIPVAHRIWLEGVFMHKERGTPPEPDASQPLPMPTGLRVVQGTATFDVTEIESFGEPILWATMGRLGLRCVATTKSLIYGSKIIAQTPEKGVTARIVVSPSNDVGLALHRANRVVFYDVKGQEAGSTRGHGLFVSNDMAYTVYNGGLHQAKFQMVQGRLLSDVSLVENITELAFKVFDGVVTQDILGQAFVSIPSGDRVCLTRKVPDLNSYRITDAVARKGFLVVMAERKRQYDRFYYHYQVNEDIHLIHKEEDVALEPVNLAVKDNGMGLLATDATLKLFTRKEVREIGGAPVDSGTKMFAHGNDVFFTHENSIFQFKSK